MSGRVPRLLFSLLLAHGLTATTAAADDDLTKLERLESSPLLLAAPDGLQGDFKVAQTAPEIDFAVFPGQVADARLWSSWGDSLHASDGLFYASVGDHAAPHGRALVYQVDPEAGTVRLVVDYNKVVQVAPDRYAPGKIHCPIVEGEDGWLYFFGYRGSEKVTTREVGYAGDWLLRYSTKTGETENLGIAVPDSSVPVLAFHPPASLYGLSVPGQSMQDPRSQFFHYDLAQRKLVFTSTLESEQGPRAFIVAPDGRVFYGARDAAGEGIFFRYDPKTTAAEKLAVKIPGDGMLRAASEPDSNGVVYCFSRDGVVFAFDTKNESVREMGSAFAAGPLYVASCRLDAAGRYLYYVPGAHGRSSQVGTPVIQLDVTTGERKVLAFLNEFLRQKKQYNLGGTYGIALSEDGSQLFINWNGSQLPLGKTPDFGLCTAMILHIPASERVGAAGEAPEASAPSEPEATEAAILAAAGEAASALVFKDVAEEVGLLPAASGIQGHAAGWGDIDGDGWIDLYVGAFHTEGSKPSMLFRNLNGKLQLDEQEAPRISTRPTGVLLVDLDNDGDLDLYIASMPAPAGSNLATKEGHPLAGCSLFRNEGGGQFTNISSGNGACPDAFGGRSATVLDFDGDGLLDLLVGEDPLPGYNGSPTASSRLFRNTGNLQFQDVTQAAGIPADIAGLGVAAADLNSDGWPDFMIVSSKGNHLFLNDGAGSFREDAAARETFAWKDAGGDNMVCGVCFGDVNADGLLDVVLGQHFKRPWVEPIPNRLFLNRGVKDGTLRFEDVTEAAGLVPLPLKAPHVEIQDFDNDGRPDIYTSIVKFADGTPHPVIFRNQGVQDGQPRFSAPALEVNDFPSDADREVKGTGAFFDKMVADKKVIYAAAAPSGDFDNDGRLDLFLANWWLESPSLLLHNQTQGGNWIQVQVTGGVGVNRMGIGARVRIYRAGQCGQPEGLLGVQEIATGYGYASSQPAIAHFGLGSEERCDVEVILPHGKGTLTTKDVPANQRVTMEAEG